MTSSLITGVRYVGLAVPDLPGAAAFYEQAWGLIPAHRERDAVFLAAAGSPEQYVLRLRHADDRRVDVLSLAVADPAGVEKVAEHVIAADCKIGTEPGTMATPGGGFGFRFFDPDGRTVEVSAEVQPRPFRQIAETESIPVRLSHVVINSPGMARMVRFYVQVLGFRVSDYLEDKMTFLRCTSAHHAVAIASAPHQSLNHVAYEMRGIDEYMRGTGRLLRSGHELVWGPGRHGPGNNTFSYFQDPGSFVCEYTTGLAVCDELRHQPRVYRSVPEESDLWGTAGRRLAEPFLGVPDAGTWVLPPF